METPDEHVLVLRTCDANMGSHGGFTWPESGPVECPDWDPAPRCGGGLHGWLWGEGDGGLGDWSEGARWLVVRASASDVVDLGGKVKFPRGEVVHCGDRESATRYLAEHGGAGRAIVGGTATAGDRGTATAGDWGTATAGDGGTATAGYRGTATAGDGGVLVFFWWDSSQQRRRVSVAEVGAGPIRRGVPHRCVDGKIVPAEEGVEV